MRRLKRKTLPGATASLEQRVAALERRIQPFVSYASIELQQTTVQPNTTTYIEPDPTDEPTTSKSNFAAWTNNNGGLQYGRIDPDRGNGGGFICYAGIDDPDQNIEGTLQITMEFFDENGVVQGAAGPVWLSFLLPTADSRSLGGTDVWRSTALYQNDGVPDHNTVFRVSFIETAGATELVDGVLMVFWMGDTDGDFSWD